MDTREDNSNLDDHKGETKHNKTTITIIFVVVIVIIGAMFYLNGNGKGIMTFSGDSDKSSSSTQDNGAVSVEDVVEGEGDTVKTGDTVMVHYTGLLKSDGSVFDTSYTRGVPFIFNVGSGQVIKGWDEGLVGMRVGGKRKLDIPSSLAYGETGAGDGVIPPNADLIFEIELLGIEGKSGKTTNESISSAMETLTETDNKKINIGDDEISLLRASGIEKYSKRATLMDVTELRTIRGINTFGASSGIVYAGFSDGNYKLNAVFNFLPDPINGDFYEGWLVRQDPPSAISTGVAESLGNGGYTNVYMSKSDLSDYDYYVLTLEPDDGDASPADHIIEGMLIEL